MTATLLAFDTAASDYGPVPANAQAILPYMDKRFRNVDAARARFPHLFDQGLVATITAGRGDADIVDWEPGNVDPPPADWYDQQHSLGRWRPGFYEDLSDGKATILPALQAHLGPLPPPGSGRPVRVLTAHPTGVPHLCGPRTCGFPREADVTQFWWSSLQGAWHGFRGDLDVNLAREDAFGVPAPVDPYAIFLRQTNPSLPNHGDERLTVEQVDGALQHPRYYPYLRGKLYGELKQFRDRIWTISKYQPPDFKTPRPVADWSSNRRGTRWQLLNDRMKKIAALPR